jgi:hypothetical protein
MLLNTTALLVKVSYKADTLAYRVHQPVHSGLPMSLVENECEMIASDHTAGMTPLKIPKSHLSGSH